LKAVLQIVDIVSAVYPTNVIKAELSRIQNLPRTDLPDPGQDILSSFWHFFMRQPVPIVDPVPRDVMLMSV
jgi:hypothetical protein